MAMDPLPGPLSPPSALSEPSPPGGATTSQPTLMRSPSSKLPQMHYLAYKGDIRGVLQCITDGHNIHEVVSLRNQHNRLVSGITPLFLAAQRGHFEVVKLLVENGANPAMPCFIQGSTELCMPAEVANLNLHFRLARYLKKATKHRKKEDKVLALDDPDADRASVASSRLHRAMERASSLRATSTSMARGSRGGAASVTGSMAVGSVVEAGTEANFAAAEFVQNMDLAAFDPEAGELPKKAKASSSIGRVFTKLFSRGDKGYEVSASQRMRGNSISEGDAGRAMRRLDLDNFDPDRPDHTKILGRFLKDLDLANWEPEADGPLAAGQGGAGPSAGGAGGPGPSASASGVVTPARTVSPARSRKGANSPGRVTPRG